MEFIRLIFAIIIITFIGYNILYLVQGRRRELFFSEILAVSFGLGIGAISLEMLFFYFVGMDFNLINMLVVWMPLILISTFLYLIDKKRSVPAELPEGKKAVILSAFLGLGIIFEILYAIFRALIKPIEAYDAIAIYAIKAKIFYLAKTIPADFFQSLITLYSHPDYPLNIPLAETFVYTFLGNLNDQLVKIIFPLYFIGILAMFYFAVRRFASRTYALLFTFLLASVPQFTAYATNGYLDIVLAYYCFTSSLLLFAWFEDRNRTGLLAVSAIMAALAAWTKNEGLMYCGINIFLILLFFVLNRKTINRKDVLSFLGYVSIIVIIYLPWAYLKRSMNIVNTEMNMANLIPTNFIRQFHKLGPVLYELQKQLFGPKKWNLLWPIAFLVFVFNYKKAFEGINKYILLSVIFAFSGYLVSYMISNVDAYFFASKTWSRFLLHLLPLVVYWMANVLKEEVKI